MFFAYDLLLAVYFIFMLDKGNEVKQKVNSNSSDFLIQIQNGSQSSGDNSQPQQTIWPRTC